MVDAVGYMTWTFFARRVKANPTYYGVKSGSEEDVELGLLKIVQDALSTLKDHDCIEISGDDDSAEVSAGILGITATSYYLNHKTPKQMLTGVREARKLISSLQDDASLPSNCLSPLVRSKRFDEVSLAWILYVLCSTHELDELPVRHNEELLNEELSEELMWGPDTSSILSDGSDQIYHMPDVYEDPHTKAFLLIQAHLQKAPLPISDYINDTKSVLDNIPRLLAAMQFIASRNYSQPGSFELLTQFSRTKQYLESRSLVQDDPLQQLPGFSSQLIRRIQGMKNTACTLYDIRRLERSDAASLFQKVTKGRDRLKGSVDATLNGLFALPLISVAAVTILSEVDKTSGKVTGKLKIDIEIECQRQKHGKGRKEATPLTMTLLVGTLQQRILLAKSSISISRSGKWTVARDMKFDWAVANADGGEEGGYVVVRLLLDEVRGLDMEQLVRLK